MSDNESDSQKEWEIEKWAKSDKERLKKWTTQRNIKLQFMIKSYKGKFHDDMKDLYGKE